MHGGWAWGGLARGDPIKIQYIYIYILKLRNLDLFFKLRSTGQ